MPENPNRDVERALERVSETNDAVENCAGAKTPDDFDDLVAAADELKGAANWLMEEAEARAEELAEAEEESNG